MPGRLLGTVPQLSLGSRQGADVPQECQVLYLLLEKTAGKVQGLPACLENTPSSFLSGGTHLARFRITPTMTRLSVFHVTKTLV